jgi:Cys-tRNA synthase (O-phospho-L-seryl-tRNA:Cys-tRNA synthase)
VVILSHGYIKFNDRAKKRKILALIMSTAQPDYGIISLISDMDTICDVTTHPDLLETAYQKGYLLGKSDAAESLQ